MRDIVNVSVGDDSSLQKMLVAQNTYSEEIIQHKSCAPRFMRTVAILCANRKIFTKVYSSAMVYMLPAFIGLSYGNVNTSISDRMQNSLKGNMLPPRETAMVVFRELHRICSVELNLGKLLPERLHRESTYCDFHVTYLHKIVGTIVFARLVIRLCQRE